MSDHDSDDRDLPDRQDERRDGEGRADAHPDIGRSALDGIDLAAWQPPPPPDGLADAVMARLRAAPAVAAIEPQPPSPGATRRMRLGQIAGAVAVAATISGLALWGTVRTPRSGHGERIATNAEHLALGATVADLDPGAELHWARTGHRIVAHQRRGTVRWTVAGDDILVLDPGGNHSAVTIEASGASLRVEVSMNFSDSRVLGVTTVSTAVLAALTVAVYQGHVQATSGGQTIRVEAGATVELRPQSPPQPPRLPEPVRDDVAIGPARSVRSLLDQLAASDLRITELTARLTAGDTGPPADAITVAPPALDTYRISGDPHIVPDEATRQQIASSRAVHNDTHLAGSFRLCLDRQGEVSRVQIVKSTRFDAYDHTIVQGLHTWKFRPYLVDRTPTPVCAVITFVYSTDKPAPKSPAGPATSCSGTHVENLVRQATNQYDRGFAPAAFAVMQKALACEQSARMYRHAGIYACAARDIKAAREMLAKLPEPDREPIAQRCKLAGLSLEPSR